MEEVYGNLWDYHGRAVIGITTAGQLSRRGECVMLRGCARQARERFPDLPKKLGALIRARGNHVFYLGEGIFNFPVENSPYEVPDFRLIERSCRELEGLANEQGWTRAVLPRPGCGGGGLEWRSVRPILARYLDERFLVIAPA
jgi:hypothetical protein